MKCIEYITSEIHGKYLFRLPNNIAGILLYSKNEYEIINGVEYYPGMLKFHNTIQTVDIFISNDGFDLFINDFVVDLDHLYEVKA